MKNIILIFSTVIFFNVILFAQDSSKTQISKSLVYRDVQAFPIQKLNIEEPVKSKQKEYPYIYLLPISIISFGLAYDCFLDMYKLDSEIRDAYKYNENIDKSGLGFLFNKRDIIPLEYKRDSRTVMAFVYVVAGIANTIISLKSVEIDATPNSINVTYQLP